MVMMNALEIFLRAEAVKIGGKYEIFPNTYAPLMVDFTKLLDMPRYFDMLTDILADKVREQDPDRVVGAFTSGIPLATAVSLKTNLPMAFVRREPKPYGRQEVVEGIINENESLVLIDDVFSKVENNLSYLKHIRKYNSQPIKIVVIFNYNIVTPIKLKEYDAELISLFSARDLLNKLEKWGKISKEEKEAYLRELKKCNA
ncbi:MAG: hypothetical protein GXN99_00235 [Candidatus Nanohaloarchaeota archaeon]|nr:hypothetical protein [Candidatus Nanohaloarchaeota archaeon]